MHYFNICERKRWKLSPRWTIVPASDHLVAPVVQLATPWTSVHTGLLFCLVYKSTTPRNTQDYSPGPTGYVCLCWSHACINVLCVGYEVDQQDNGFNLGSFEKKPRRILCVCNPQSSSPTPRPSSCLYKALKDGVISLFLDEIAFLALTLVRKKVNTLPFIIINRAKEGLWFFVPQLQYCACLCALSLGSNLINCEVLPNNQKSLQLGKILKCSFSQTSNLDVHNVLFFFFFLDQNDLLHFMYKCEKFSSNNVLDV